MLTRVVGLAKVAVQTSSRRRINNAAVLLFPEMGPSSSSTLVGTLDVDLEDEVPVLILHILEADIPQNTGIVDQDVDAAEGLDGGFDDLVAVLDRIVVGNGLAAGFLDLVDHNIGSLCCRQRPDLELVWGQSFLTFADLPSPV